MAFTLRSGSFITFDEASTFLQRLGMDDPTDSTTSLGQAIVVAANAAYDEIIRCLRTRGYTLVQIGTWVSRKEVHLYLTAFYGGRDPTLKAGSEYFDPVLKSYRELWQEICAGAAIYDESGDFIDPDETADGASQFQVGVEDRNGPQGQNNDFVFQWSPDQMSGAPGVAYTVAGYRMGNKLWNGC